MAEHPTSKSTGGFNWLDGIKYITLHLVPWRNFQIPIARWGSWKFGLGHAAQTLPNALVTYSQVSCWDTWIWAWMYLKLVLAIFIRELDPEKCSFPWLASQWVYPWQFSHILLFVSPSLSLPPLVADRGFRGHPFWNASWLSALHCLTQGCWMWYTGNHM